MSPKNLLRLKGFAYTLGYAFIIAALFFVAETLYRYYNPLLHTHFSTRFFGELWLIHFLLLSLKSRRTIVVTYSILMTLFVTQLIHFSYYGSWIFPLEYILFFTKFKETLDTFSTVLDVTFIPLAITLPFTIALIVALKKFDTQRFYIPYLGPILVMVLIFLPVRTYLNDKTKKGARPNMKTNVIRNTFETMGFMVGRILVNKVTGESQLMKPIVKTPPLLNKDPNINVIVIMGESLSYHHMSVLGYERQTTPLLDARSKRDDFLALPALAGGVCTDVAIPSFMNMVAEPDNTAQIISTNTCLFKMAKDNGFTTAFISAQSPEGLKQIKSYLCLGFADLVMDSSGAKNLEVDGNAYDEVLLERVKEIDFKKSNFVVLHQIGSHSPHEWRYPEGFEKYKGKNNVDYYDNSVYYTDYVIGHLMEYIEAHSDKPTYIVFTSDHATSVGNDNVRGHGSLDLDVGVEVPFVLQSFHDDRNVTGTFKDVKHLSHLDISRFVASLLGYKIDKIIDDSKGYFVCGRDLSGVDGYTHYTFDGNKTHKEIVNP